MKVIPYLNFAGDTEAAFTFYATCLKQPIAEMVRFRDIPMGVELSDEDANKVMHVRIDLGAGAIMGNDALPALGQAVSVGNHSYISIHPEGIKEGQRIFDALSEGGQIESPFALAPWGDHWGAFRDKFGIPWMVNVEKP